jgi:hypothetical protein
MIAEGHAAGEETAASASAAIVQNAVTAPG